MEPLLQDKKILVFGGTGSLGHALIRRLSIANRLHIFSRDEAKHWTIRNRLNTNQQVDFVVGDIRDHRRVHSVIRQFKPDIVIIAAALKQVDTCELSPYESIQTNILGIHNVVQSVLDLDREITEGLTVLMVSTDKACAPTNVYGMSKAISERLVTSSSAASDSVRFIGVRYGNVLDSRGSILPLFRFQAQQRQSITVTHQEMTRFIMTLDESIDLIESTILGATTGQIWLPKLKSMRILDLAKIFAERHSLEIAVTGIRPGEKLHEELISEAESLRVIDDKSKFFKMNPSNSTLTSQLLFNYSSEDYLVSPKDLESSLDKLEMLSRPLSDFVGREIEEISGR